MVTKPTAAFRPGLQPQNVARLVETSLRLWLASMRPCLPWALLYSLAGLLPGLAFAEVGARLLRFGIDTSIGLLRHEPIDEGEVEVLAAELGRVLTAPSTSMLLGGSLLLGFAALVPMLRGQWLVAQGETPNWRRVARLGLARLPAGLGAWAVFMALILLAALPMLAFISAMLTLTLGSEPGPFGLVLWMLVFFFGALALSIPLCWISVAASLSPLLSANLDCGPLAAQRESLRLVRGHWVHAALVTALPLLIYLGVGSAVSSTLLTLCASIALSSGGWDALTRTDWLLWSQVLGVVPMALALPLAFAGFSVCLQDLRLRQSRRQG